MTKTTARHRAPVSARAWAARTWLGLSALPVGALAGCTALGVAASFDRPALGLVGLGAVVVPWGVASWRARLTGAAQGHGRRALGRPVVPAPLAPATPAPVTATAGPGTDLARLPLVLDAPDLRSLQRATGRTGSAALPVGAVAEDAPSRLFTVTAGGHEVEVVVLTRAERAARDLAVLAATAPRADAPSQRLAA